METQECEDLTAFLLSLSLAWKICLLDICSFASPVLISLVPMLLLTLRCLKKRQQPHFHTIQRGVHPHRIVLGSPGNLKGNFHNVGSLDVLQIKEDVLKFLATGIHLDGTTLELPMEQYIYKRKGDGIHIVHLKRT